MSGLRWRRNAAWSPQLDAGALGYGEPVSTTLSQRIADRVNESLAAGIGSGAVVQVRHGGRVVTDYSAGVLLSYDGTGSRLPEGDQPAVHPDTWFDLASLTKVVSTMTLLTLVRRGELALDAPIGEHLPTYQGSEDPRRGDVTLRHLLTHTSGLPAVWGGWRDPLTAYLRAHPDQLLAGWPADDRAALIASLLAVELEHRPGSHWEYSCVGYNTAMLLAEAATSLNWPELVHQCVLEPLSLVGQMAFGADPSHCAATEVEPHLGRGVVWGQVHDESSWSLGGACANAGLFGSAAAVAVLGEVIRTGHTPEGEPHFDPELMWANALPAILGRELADPVESPWGHSLGLRIGQVAWMGAHGRHSRGHTGFTGTSVQIDRDEAVTIVVLTNRVHPTRDGDPGHRLRAAVADQVWEWVEAGAPGSVQTRS